MYESPDPRGHLRSIVEILPLAKSTHPQIVGMIQPVKLSCGHIVQFNPVMTYKVGGSARCIQCMDDPQPEEK